MLVNKRDASQSGSSIVEMALILPVFFLLVFGIIQISIVLFGYNSAVYASQLAVHYAVTHGGDAYYGCSAAQVAAIVTKNLWGAPASGTSVSVVWTPNNNAGSTVTVSVSIAYHTGIPFSSLSMVKVGTSTVGTMLY